VSAPAKNDAIVAGLGRSGLVGNQTECPDKFHSDLKPGTARVYEERESRSRTGVTV